jgi:uncharacterized tellurite resistance protein B-like protein
MIDGIRDFFTRVMRTPASAANANADASEAEAEEAARRRLHVAACALLLELAHADDEFSDAERAHVRESLRRHLDLDEPTTNRLLELAEEERASAIDLYQFTSLVRDNYDLAQKTLLAEIMWGVVLADGSIEQDESIMLRKIGNLLDLEPGFLSHARKQVGGRRG